MLSSTCTYDDSAVPHGLPALAPACLLSLLTNCISWNHMVITPFCTRKMPTMLTRSLCMRVRAAAPAWAMINPLHNATLLLRAGKPT